jgi:hypothetical protein
MIFFEIIRIRYETGSMIITTNRNFEDWGLLFGDNVMASAIIDRVVHHAQIIKIKGDSYRVKNLKNSLNITERNTMKNIIFLTLEWYTFRYYSWYTFAYY